MIDLEYLDANQGVLGSNQLNIATFVHQMGDVCLPSGGQNSKSYFIL